jgi:hypothetical protein
MGVPQLFNISGDAVKRAEESRSFHYKIPEQGVTTKVNKKGQTESRWVEPVKIVRAFCEDKAGREGQQRVQFTLQFQAKIPSENKGKMFMARQLINFPALMSDSDVDEVMNDISINLLKTLFTACGVAIPATGISADLLNGAFPAKEAGGQSALAGQEVFASFVDKGPNEWGRDQGVESYTGEMNA